MTDSARRKKFVYFYNFYTNNRRMCGIIYVYDFKRWGIEAGYIKSPSKFRYRRVSRVIHATVFRLFELFMIDSPAVALGSGVTIMSCSWLIAHILQCGADWLIHLVETVPRHLELYYLILVSSSTDGCDKEFFQSSQVKMRRKV